MRRLLLTVFAALALTACLPGERVETRCRIDDLPEHPCPSMFGGDEIHIGAITGDELIQWYGDQITPGVHSFTVRLGDQSDTWWFEVLPDLPDGTV